MKSKKAHIVVDMLYDFIDGSMACHNSEGAVEASIQFINSNPNELLFYVADSHPANHCSFKEFGGIWPPHCVVGTKGGEIHSHYYTKVKEESQRAHEQNILRKGESADEEQYSGFEAVSSKGESLESLLRGNDIEEVNISGIATEFCINATALDLKKAGFKVNIIEKGLAYVEHKGHLETIERLKSEGISMI